MHPSFYPSSSVMRFLACGLSPETSFPWNPGLTDGGSQEDGLSPHCHQRDRDKGQIFIQVVSRCSICPPRELPSKSLHPLQTLPPPCYRADIPWVSQPLSFPMGSCFLLFGALLPLVIEGIWRPGWWIIWTNNTSWAALLRYGGPWLPGNLICPRILYVT